MSEEKVLKLRLTSDQKNQVKEAFGISVDEIAVTKTGAAGLSGDEELALDQVTGGVCMPKKPVYTG